VIRLPDFICVGAQKAGTSWLHKQLACHPQIYMKVKEVNYFYTQNDLFWYAEHFEDASSCQICGDISPNYSAFAEVPARINLECPGAKILFLLRSPVDRAFSQWRMARHLGNIPLETSFLEAFEQNMQFMKERGEYARIIKDYTRFFPLHSRSQVFWYDTIVMEPAALVKDVLTFIGADPHWQSPHLNDIVWSNPDPGSIDPTDAREVGLYYEPFDDSLRTLLAVNQLPWDKTS
jgi:hypothetical protein